ncbi:MAG: hypothetical protein ABIU05_25560 [Nitrospirales bacterium]
MLIESSKPLLVKLPSGNIRMQPGHPVAFSTEDGEKLLARVPGKVRVICQAGSSITWLSATGPQVGVVDFVHTDNTGTVWAFVTMADESWAAVNMKFATVKP